MNNIKVLVVYHNKSKKLIPFILDKFGCVEIISTNVEYNDDEDMIVSFVDPKRLDLSNGYLLGDGEIYGEN